MTNPSLAFTDGIGAASLVASVPTFKSWTPDVHDIGDSQVPVGDSATFFFSLRQDFVVTFDVDQIPKASLAIVQRLKSWLVTGGSITINTEDSAGHVYTATLVPGTVPTITMSDRENVEYTLHLELINQSADAFLYTPVAPPSSDTLTFGTGPLFFQTPCGVATQDIIATLVDGDGVPIAGATIDGVSNNEGSFTISPSSGTTDSLGQVTFTVTKHIEGSGAVHAVAGALIASVDVQVGVWEWLEDFDEADYATFRAIYAPRWQWFAPVDAEAYLTLSGGALRLNGPTADGVNSINFGPPVIDTPFAPINQFWMKIEVEMIGGDFDGFGSIAGDTEFAMPVYSAFYGDGGEIDLESGNIFFFGGGYAPPGFYGIQFDGPPVQTTIADALTAGLHTFIMCFSNDGSVSNAELWIDKAPGDAPDAVNVGSYLVNCGPGDGLDHLYVQFAPPKTAGRVLAIHQIHVLGVPRAVNPFGIL